MNTHRDYALEYESFVRYAFGFALGEPVGRGKDPAGLGDTSIFTDDNIASVKAAIIYSMEIFISDVANHKFDTLDDIERARLDSFPNSVICAQTLLLICDLINNFNSTVRDRYYRSNNGILTLI